MYGGLVLIGFHRYVAGTVGEGKPEYVVPESASKTE